VDETLHAAVLAKLVKSVVCYTTPSQCTGDFERASC